MRKFLVAAIAALTLGAAAPAMAQTAVPALSIDRLAVGLGADVVTNTAVDPSVVLPNTEVRFTVPIAYKLGKLSALVGYAGYNVDINDFSKGRTEFGVGLRVRVFH